MGTWSFQKLKIPLYKSTLMILPNHNIQSSLLGFGMAIRSSTSDCSRSTIGIENDWRYMRYIMEQNITYTAFKSFENHSVIILIIVILILFLSNLFWKIWCERKECSWHFKRCEMEIFRNVKRTLLEVWKWQGNYTNNN